MIDLGAWSTDQQSFNKYMRLFGLLRKVKTDEASKLFPVEGLAISGPFKITKEQAVFGVMADEGDIELVTPAVLFDGLYYNLRLSDDLANQITKDIEQHNEDGELLPIFDRTNLKNILVRRDRTHKVEQGRGDDAKRPAAFANDVFEIYDTGDIATPHNVFA